MLRKLNKILWFLEKPKGEKARTEDSIFCNCGDTTVTGVAFFETAQLKNGHWTQFVINKCNKCGKFLGFPHDNMLNAIENGRDDTLEELRKLGLPVDKYRNKTELKNLAELNPSYRRKP